MGFSSGWMNKRILVQRRKKAEMGKHGLDSTQIGWEDVQCLWANVTWQKGVSGLREGSVDVYGVIMVRTRWTTEITARSRIVYEGQIYNIIPETFHPDRQENTLQFLAQAPANANVEK